MYKQIDFTTDITDENGHKLYRPPTVGIAKFIKESYFQDYKFGFKLGGLSLQVFVTPYIRRASWFSSEKLGEREYLGIFIFDMETEKLTFIKEYNKKQRDHDFSIPDYLLSFLRPTDFVLIKVPDVDSEGKKCISKLYYTKGEIIDNTTSIKIVEKHPDERFFKQESFFKKEKVKKGKNNARKRATKVRRQRG